MGSRNMGPGLYAHARTASLVPLLVALSMVACGVQADNEAGSSASRDSTGTAVVSSNPPGAPPPIAPAPSDFDPPVDTTLGPSAQTTLVDGSWVLGAIPTGFSMVLVTDQAGWRQAYYQDESTPGDVYDAPITVTVSFEDPGPVEVLPNAAPVGIRGVTSWTSLRGRSSSTPPSGVCCFARSARRL